MQVLYKVQEVKRRNSNRLHGNFKGSFQRDESCLFLRPFKAWRTYGYLSRNDLSKQPMRLWARFLQILQKKSWKTVLPWNLWFQIWYRGGAPVKSRRYYIISWNCSMVLPLRLKIWRFFYSSSSDDNCSQEESCKWGHVILTATSRRYRKGCNGGFCRMFPEQGSLFLSTKRRQRHSGKTDGFLQKVNTPRVVESQGNFDDAQSAVKRMFNDQDLAANGRNGFQFSSANSINIGRLVPQIVCYVYAYAKLVKWEERSMPVKINITVPTGNFEISLLLIMHCKADGAADS